MCSGNRFGGELEERLQREWGRLGACRYSGYPRVKYAGLHI